MALTPGWHTTIFPPYFVAGAIFSGIGMVFTIIIPLRKWFKLKHYVTINDLDAAAKLCLFTSLVVGCAYLTEFQSRGTAATRSSRSTSGTASSGQWWWAAWIMLHLQHGAAAVALLAEAAAQHDLALHPLDLHQPRDVVRALRDRRAVAVARVRAVAVGAAIARRGWTTRFCSAAFGWFFMWFLLFIKQLPVMAIAEIKEIVPPKLRARASTTASISRAGIDAVRA